MKSPPQVALELTNRYLVRLGNTLNDSMKLQAARDFYENGSCRIGFGLYEDGETVGAGFVTIHNATPIDSVDAIHLGGPTKVPTYSRSPRNPDFIDRSGARTVPPRIINLQKGEDAFITLDGFYHLGPYLSPPFNYGSPVARDEAGNITSRLVFVLSYIAGSPFASRGVHINHPEDEHISYKFWKPLGSIDSPKNGYPVILEKKYFFDLLDRLGVGFRATSRVTTLRTEQPYADLAQTL